MKTRLEKLCGKSAADSSYEEIYKALMTIIKEESRSKIQAVKGRKLYYISAEFLIGRLLSNNLINLGLYDEVNELLAASGKSMAELEDLEPEPSLGNGGLGRLAACFLDSLATLNLPGDGVGLRYHCGLFRQDFKNHVQNETPDYWLDGSQWAEDTGKTYPVSLGGKTYQARLYQLDVTGYQGRTNKLNLFDLDTVDETLITEGIDFDKERIEKNLTLFLYPDDSDDAGRKLRIYQQYFMVSAGAQMILEECEERGSNFHDLADYAAIQINDTHPSMVIPELIRLLEERGIAFEEAAETVTKTCAYTNHTILAEALEKWPEEYLEEVVPQLMPVIRRLDQMVKDKAKAAAASERTEGLKTEDKNETIAEAGKAVTEEAKKEDESTWIIDKDRRVHMAHMDIHFTHSTNGVAALHTEILKNSELNQFYRMYPEKFNNKTNGITFRRWLLSCNHELAEYMESLIGAGFKKDAMELKKLKAYEDDGEVLKRLREIKRKNKKKFADWLFEKQKITVNPDSMFLIQSKRLHEYKRQQLNLLYLIHQYFEIRNGYRPAAPITAIFGAKAAPAYITAKNIIHALLTLSRVIERDPEVSKWIQVVVIENYNVTAAEKMIPACDLSEQISLASKEASGTGNMKFMLNGAVTLGTLDGANVEIADCVGEDNIYIFGQSSEQVIRRYAHGDYCAREWYETDPNIRRALDFIDGELMLAEGNEACLRSLKGELVGKDWFQTLPDFNAYLVRKNQAIFDYAVNPEKWEKMALCNISGAGFFSSDRTIEEYNRDIWHLK